MKLKALILMVLTALAVICPAIIPYCAAAESAPDTAQNTRQVLITAVGDCTLGTDSTFGSESTLLAVIDDNNGDLDYVFRGVYPGYLYGQLDNRQFRRYFYYFQSKVS